MPRRIVLVGLVAAVAVVVAVVSTALATPSSGVTAETARGELTAPLHVNREFDNGARVKLKTSGPIELVAQRIVAEPGATFGWHHHPGENVNVVLQGTLTLYHDEACTVGIDYPAGKAFSTSPNQIHLAKNNGSTPLILYATYFMPKTTPPTPVRVDEPLPAPGCPQ